MVNMDPKYTSLYLKHKDRVMTLIPFYNPMKPTALYYLDKLRYGKYFAKSEEKRGKPIYEEWHKVKWNLQQMHQRELEEQGAILKDIFLQREANESTKAIDYLLWISYQWDIYQAYLADGGEDEGFIRFVQSELSYRENP